MGSRLDVSPFLLSAKLFEAVPRRDSRTEKMALSLPLILRFFLLPPFSALARTGV